MAKPEVDPDEGWDFNPGEEYQTPLEQTLASFGSDLVNDKPRLGKVIQDAKARIKEESEAARSDRKDAPKPK